MTAKEALKDIEGLINKLSMSSYDVEITEFNLRLVHQALEELEAIKSIDIGEAIKRFNTCGIRKAEGEYCEKEDTDFIESTLLKAQAQEQELEELKKSDESKEQSSIDYYNEMRKYKKELAKLKKKYKVRVAFYKNTLKCLRDYKKEIIKLKQYREAIWNLEELLDLTPDDIRDIATYTYEELRQITNFAKEVKSDD